MSFWLRSARPSSAFEATLEPSGGCALCETPRLLAQQPPAPPVPPSPAASSCSSRIRGSGLCGIIFVLYNKNGAVHATSPAQDLGRPSSTGSAVLMVEPLTAWHGGAQRPWACSSQLVGESMGLGRSEVSLTASAGQALLQSLKHHSPLLDANIARTCSPCIATRRSRRACELRP